jgi:hypothetical protein
MGNALLMENTDIVKDLGDAAGMASPPIRESPRHLEVNLEAAPYPETVGGGNIEPSIAHVHRVRKATSRR